MLAHPAIYSCLALFFNAMNVHGYVSNQLELSVVILTLKCSTKSIYDIENYRLISIMSVMVKVYEKCIANVIKPYFIFHENQFGFVKKLWLWQDVICF